MLMASLAHTFRIFSKQNGKAPIVSFMQDFRSVTAPAEGQKRLWTPESGEGVTLSLRRAVDTFSVKRRDVLYINHIAANIPGHGEGSKAMRMLAQLADEHGVQLGMVMQEVAGKEADLYRLIQWTEKFGFEELGACRDPYALVWRDPGGTGPGAAPAP